jgi:hypothetical protein
MYCDVGSVRRVEAASYDYRVGNQLQHPDESEGKTNTRALIPSKEGIAEERSARRQSGATTTARGDAEPQIT